MEHRRRGADFSRSLEAFLNSTADCRSVLEPATQEAQSSTQTSSATSYNDKTYDGDKRMNSKPSSGDNTSASSSFKSTILAGQAAEPDSQRTSGSSYQTAKSDSVTSGMRFGDASLESRRQLQVPSVTNRPISLQFSPQPELDLSQTSAESRSSGVMNRNIASSSEKSSDESRDTNYNIKGSSQELPTTSMADVVTQGSQSPEHKFRASTPRACGLERKDTWLMLSNLDKVSDPPNERTTKNKQKILRRLSQEFMYSPRTFTERLLTIIDESETGFAGDEASGVNLSRMTKEFRKMCKFIQDESMPEMAPSLCMNSMLGTTCYPDENKYACHERPETIFESPPDSPSSDCRTPQPDVHTKTIYRKTPLNIFKNTFAEKKAVGSPGSSNSTRDFEYWEKYCESLPNSPKSPSRNRPQPPRRSLSTSDISEETKEKLLTRCEEQLRSLDDTNTVEFETFDSHRGQGARNGEIGPQAAKTRDASTVAKDEHGVTQSCGIDYAEDLEDEFSKSVMIEKEKQRQRCFETARLMQKIEEDAKKTNEEYPKALERYGIDPEEAFMKTINTCLAYKNCVSGIRQSSQPARKDGSSVDSGIDTRSFGRTLYASSKKSCSEASVGNSHKQSRKHGVTSIRPNSARLVTGAIKKTGRKAVSSENLYQPNTRRVEKRSAAVSPRRNAGYLRPAAKSLAPSRSPTYRKRSPTPQITTKTRATETPERCRPNRARENSPAPEVLVIPSSPTISAGRLNPLESEGQRPGSSSRSNTPKSISQRAKSPGASTPTTAKILARSPRRRFFVTPGRTLPVNQKRKTKTYFPSMDEEINRERSQLMKSPHAPGLYRLGYNTVVSPISMYIRGTDVHLIHNNHERKNEMMLTPSKLAASEERLKFRLASKSSTPKSSPRTKCLFADKEGSESDDNDENIQEEFVFALPKANYNQPAQVHTVNQSPKLIRGARTKDLLRTMQDRVVIRHEGKRFGRNKEDNKVPESSTDCATDTSIHVLKTAEKTDYMSRRMI